MDALSSATGDEYPDRVLSALGKQRRLYSWMTQGSAGRDDVILVHDSWNPGDTALPPESFITVPLDGRDLGVLPGVLGDQVCLQLVAATTPADYDLQVERNSRTRGGPVAAVAVPDRTLIVGTGSDGSVVEVYPLSFQ